jgi:transcriptional regulator GlxA family with amidase domain
MIKPMKSKSVVIVGYQDAEMLDISCVSSSFEAVNRILDAPAYRCVLATPGGHPITTSAGMQLNGQATLERLTDPIDTLVVSGGWGHERVAADPRFIGHVRRLASLSRRVSSVCTGASILAETGLLDGKRATTHWNFAEQLAAGYPAVTVDPRPIYIRDGDVATAAGVTSALDLTLSFIEEDFGAPVARWAARVLVTYLQRPGNQAQMSMFVAAPPVEDGLVRQIADYVAANLSADLSAAALAQRANLSQRHLNRLFQQHLDRTPGRYVRQVRLAAAAQLLESTSLPMSRVAGRCGFGSAETLRQAFTQQYGVSPSQYRATHSHA